MNTYFHVLCLAVLSAGCYSPDVRSCSLRCGPNGDCPRGTACNRGFCASASDECRANPADAGDSGIDISPDMAPDSAADRSSNVDGDAVAPVAITIEVHGRGTVSGGGATCTADSSPCVIAVLPDTLLSPTPEQDSEFDTWTGVCSGRGACVPTASGSVIATFVRSPGIQLASGYAFNCVLLRNGRVFCWGSGAVGRLGTGSETMSPVPVQVLGLRPTARVVQIDAGGAHACATYDDGGLSCWGENVAGQIDPGVSKYYLSAVEVFPAGTGIRQVCTGGRFTCAIGPAGAVKCWGLNDAGQLGDGTLDSRATPQPLPGLSAAAISCAEWHACALDMSASVLCWGGNSDGSVGVGSTSSPVTVPTVISGTAATQFGSVTAGYHCSAAVAYGDAATLWRWGSGPMGDGTSELRTSPISSSSAPLTGNILDGVAQVAVGGGHMCARLRSGALLCWGGNGNGQLGDGTRNAIAELDRAAAPLGATKVLDVTAYIATTCAIREDGVVLCWGEGREGQVGNNTFSDSVLSPEEVVWPE